MRSFFCYVRTLDNQFLSCSVAVDNEEKLCVAAFKRFSDLGNPLPPPNMIYTMRFCADPRNELDMAGYEEERANREPPPDDGYCVYSELTPETPRS